MLGLALMPVLSGGRLSAQGQGQPSIGLNGDGTSRVVPHPASAVEIRSTKRGVLLPRLTAGQRHILRVEPSTAGLTVYQTDSVAGLYVWDGTVWQYLNPGLVLSDEDGQLRFATVAVTGSYNDLTGRPVLPTTPDGDGFAKVAYTGDYYDLIDLPEIPKSLQGLRLVAITGEYKDLDRRPAIPERTADLKTDEFYRLVSDADRRRWDSASQRVILSRLRELAQDSLHRTVTQEEKERWQTAAARSIPSTLSDMKTDDYYMTVTLAEKEAWNRHAATPIPKALYDLKSDEYAQTVSSRDIERWDSAASRYIPTRLRELRQDSLHRTLTSSVKAALTAAAEREIPTRVSDLMTDYSHLIVTEEQAGRWDEAVTLVGFSGDYRDLTNKPVIPDSLCQILSDDFYQDVSAADKARWETMVRRQYKQYLTDLTDDAEHRVPLQRDVDRWNAGASRQMPSIAEAAFSGDYEDIPYDYQYKPYSKDLAKSGSFEYINNLSNDYPVWASVALTGDYNDLNGRPEDIYRDKMEVSYQSLVDTPAYVRVAVTGDFKDLADYETLRKKSHWSGDTRSAHVTAQKRDEWNGLVDELTKSGVHGDFTGPYNALRVKADCRLPYSTMIEGGFSNPDGRTDAVLTYGQANAMDAKNIADIKNGSKSVIPSGSIIFYYSPNGQIPDGWEVVGGMQGRFPVGYGGSSGTFGAVGGTGGEERHTLTDMEIPAHTHKAGITPTYHLRFGNDNDKSTEFSTISRETRYETAYTGGGLSHENRPPYFALYILRKK